MDDTTGKIIIDQLKEISSDQKETRTCVDELSIKMGLALQKTEFELQNIHKTDDVQNKLLDDHIKGVNTLTVMHEEQRGDINSRLKQVDDRFDKVEAPQKAFSYIAKLTGKIGIVASALYGILKLFGVF